MAILESFIFLSRLFQVLLDKATPLFPIFVLCIFSCQSKPTPPTAAAQDPEKDIKTLYVNSQKSLCSNGTTPQTCLMVRDKPTDEWRLFYDDIKDFQYQEGFQFEIKIKEVAVENPPADGSSKRYLWVRTIRKTLDPIMDLDQPESIDTWAKNIQNGSQNITPTEKEATRDGVSWKIQTYEIGGKPMLIRAESKKDGTVQEYYFHGQDIALLREWIPGINPVENRFYFHDKAFMKALSRQIPGKMATDAVPLAPYKSKYGKTDFRLKFNDVMQSGYLFLAGK